MTTKTIQPDLLPTHLRIGNYLNLLESEDEYQQVRSFDNETMSFKDHISWDGIGYDEVMPLPITEQWLLKLGFEERKESDNFSKWWIGENPQTKDWLFLLKNFKDDNSFFFQNGYHTIYHVHELQNLFFSLTGEELIVTQ